MNNKQTEKKIAESFASAKPNIYDDVAAQCPTRSPSKARKNNALGWKIATCALALIMVVAVVFGGVTLGQYGQQNSVVASVTLDVNPSVAIRLNGNRRVISVDALNLDGEKIIGSMDFSGAQLEVTVNALIGSMIRSGKLSADSNSVLVSVDAKNSEYGALADIVSREITVILQESQIESSVVSQRLDNTDNADELAAEYGISVGKAQLIIKIMQNAPEGRYTVQQLVQLKINELNLILNGLSLPQDEISQNGAASEGKYIGRDAAIAAALNSIAAGLTQNDVQRLVCKMDFDDGVMVYEVEFVYKNFEYDVEINALDGKIIGVESEAQNTRPNQSELTEEQIKQKALELAEVPQAERDSVNVMVERDLDDGVMEYDVKFSYNGKYYEFDIDGYGNILSASQKEISSGSSESDLTRVKIRQKILEAVTKDSRFASLTLQSTREWEIEMDVEHGRQVYEVEFKWGRYEFDCVLDVATGNVTFKAELDD